MVHNYWNEASNVELSTLEYNATWALTTLPLGKGTVECKWVFKVKFRPNGSIKRHKVHLVAKGYTQTVGIDYLENFSLVVKMTTLQVLLSIAAAKG